MKSLQETTISHYKSIFSHDGEAITIQEALLRIKNGIYGDMVGSCRSFLSNDDLKSYKKAKALLPATTFSGLFENARKSEEILCYSNSIILDIDGLGTNQLEDTKSTLSEDKHIYAMWESPSGKGLKILLPVTSIKEEHKLCFDTLSSYFQKVYNISLDKSGSDISRLCFYSHDSEILIKDVCESFDYKLYPEYTLLPQTISRTEPKNITYAISERRAYYDTNNRNDPRDRRTIGLIIKYLKARKLSITTSYDNWYRVALAIANTFTLEIGSKYYLSLCELDGELHDEYKSNSLLEYCYRHRRYSTINFATIIYLAQSYGFKIQTKK